jgi:hypothetical protein
MLGLQDKTDRNDDNKLDDENTSAGERIHEAVANGIKSFMATFAFGYCSCSACCHADTDTDRDKDTTNTATTGNPSSTIDGKWDSDTPTVCSVDACAVQDSWTLMHAVLVYEKSLLPPINNSSNSNNDNDSEIDAAAIADYCTAMQLFTVDVWARILRVLHHR